MEIEHLAIWVDDIELMRQFYMEYFDVICGEKYVNTKRNYTSYFLSFGENKSRIELMHIPDVLEPTSRGQMKGFAHFAISVGGKDIVDTLIEKLRKNGYTIAGEPRTTGDGYYESVVLDPEGNYVELVAAP
ncbi:glyoxalase/bleomycin resistance/extradiol dioxygenase family protein [Dysgonomonas sp. 216]|uniref:VOC family protein n=1 Tax=Dysgonomonas sp. 216 TaxID=2302934 RepID=UPI0013D630DE|nr:VOC family protein [Dysgonomonas sp. 216]NDW19389.1 glyoxalase/bleomycin resistance/extradiol dioxygenase family protein [Dysgonomonas sp. 216]